METLLVLEACYITSLIIYIQSIWFNTGFLLSVQPHTVFIITHLEMLNGI